MKRKLLLSFMVLTMVATLVACSGNGSGTSGTNGGDAQTYVLKVGTVTSETDPLFEGLKVFKANVEERTGGAVEVELYSGAQLGADEDVLEQAIVGAGVGIITDPGRMSNYVKDFGILGGPYLADNYEGALELMETTVYSELVDEFEEHGLKILSFNYFQGSRHLYTKSPVSEPGDLNGLRIRSSGSDIVTRSLEAMGANTTVLAWSEAYQALQQRVVEGVEVHNSAAYGSSIYEVTDYVSLTSHFQLLTGLVISNGWFETLPAEFQQILVEEAYAGGQHASELVLEKDAEFLQMCIDGGVELVEVDLEAFKLAAESAYDVLGYRELKDAIDAELGR
ncbi:C4-dicarboxylate TRAP transporter substrate-binding protein [Anoxynatronum buryatiense]|uniref:TRAP-type C4-dicarboxylate transport system, substrate-binding protein n=1 Tax=Anoxynatronum buryatiense TaxID=489973 RepID=A0AA46AJC7_9CLOT|nr:C4-dicarboxylate TRAP transporter substrate-binding protein [Anoxynatronum buryatiense]SMP59027.1 TRAP-type C4-dicarboxylate transport system, substrate-binding protein [Anoxynatronum buryatiense]